MMASTHHQDEEQPPSPSKPLDIGIIVIGHLPPSEKDAVRLLPSALKTWLDKHFLQFQWRFRLVTLPYPTTVLRQEPAHLLDEGARLRDLHKWDFGIIITPSDLVSRYKSYALAATSSALDLAVISTYRLVGASQSDPKPAPPQQAATGAPIEFAERNREGESLLAALQTLCLRAIAHLAGLSSRDEHNNLMLSPQSPDDLMAMTELDPEQRAMLHKNFELIADPRLEEVKSSAGLSNFHFYARSAWINRHELIAAVAHAKPWELPFRLLRLSAAAISTMLILLITAETWELASAQHPSMLAFIMLATLCCTTVFVTFKQRLLIRSHIKQPSEQAVISHISALLIVSIGMITTALALIGLTLALGYFLYPQELIARWTNTTGSSLYIAYWQTACLVSAEGLLLGALGASFEEQYHFRHIVFVDEEL